MSFWCLVFILYVVWQQFKLEGNASSKNLFEHISATACIVCLFTVFLVIQFRCGKRQDTISDKHSVSDNGVLKLSHCCQCVHDVDSSHMCFLFSGTRWRPCAVCHGSAYARSEWSDRLAANWKITDESRNAGTRTDTQTHAKKKKREREREKQSALGCCCWQI